MMRKIILLIALASMVLTGYYQPKTHVPRRRGCGLLKKKN